jgi:hypothetical protein
MGLETFPAFFIWRADSGQIHMIGNELDGIKYLIFRAISMQTDCGKSLASF